jgi:hypothetical protein
MRVELVKKTLNGLMRKGVLNLHSNILVVCGAHADRDLFLELGFNNVTITNMDTRQNESDYLPYPHACEDASQLSYDDNSFEICFESDGLHHCRSPHAALLEMYRVSQKAIIVVESQDNMIVNLMVKLGISEDYEIGAVQANDMMYGGVNNSCIPNFVYRWTKNEFQKTIRSFDPIAPQKFYFYYGLSLPLERLSKSLPVKLFVLLLQPIAIGLTNIFPKLGNTFVMVALKPKIPKGLWPWLSWKGNKISFNEAYSQSRRS